MRAGTIVITTVPSARLVRDAGRLLVRSIPYMSEQLLADAEAGYVGLAYREPISLFRGQQTILRGSIVPGTGRVARKAA